MQRCDPRQGRPRQGRPRQGVLILLTLDAAL